MGLEQVKKIEVYKRPRWPMFLLLIGIALCASKSYALALSSYFESVLVQNVSSTWTTVTLDNTYSNAIPVCTYVLGTFAGSNPNYTNLPSVTRIRNISANSFQVRVQAWENASASPADVHCIVMEEGAHRLPDGRSVEAHRVISDKAIMENVSADFVHSYLQPVVVGQVISFNDPRASVIQVSDCGEQEPEFQRGMADSICVGKHIGRKAGNHANELIGYIVGETGSGAVNDVFYELALGTASISGKKDGNTGYSYPMTRHHTMAVLTQKTDVRTNASWAVLYGDNPFTNGSMSLAIDEEFVSGSSYTSRRNAVESVYYWAFSGADIIPIRNVVNDDGRSASAAVLVSNVQGPAGQTGIGATGVVSDRELNGHTAAAESCVDSSGLIAGLQTTGPVSGEPTILREGANVNCESLNDDIAAQLTLTNTVLNDDGGLMASEDFDTSIDAIELTLVKTVDDSTPNIGQRIFFTLSVTNAGPDNATNVTVVDPVPAGFTYVAGSIAGGDVASDSDPAGTGLNWTINTLSVGTPAALTFQAIVNAP